MSQARQETIIAGADRLPQIAAGLQAQRSRPAAQGASPTNTLSLNLNFSWEIDLWGRLKNQRQAAFQDWLSSKENYQAAYLSLAAQTVTAWFNAIEAYQQVDLAQAKARSLGKSAALLQNRYGRGLSNALELRNILSSQANAHSQVTFLQSQSAQAVRTLEVLLGRYPSQALQLREKKENLPSLRQTVPAGIPAQLLERRPDIRAAYNELSASRFRAKAAFKSLLPSITLTGNIGSSSASLNELLRANTSLWSVAGGVLQPIFQGRQLKASYQQKKDAIAESAARYTATLLQAFQEVESALTNEALLRQQILHLHQLEEETIAAEQLTRQQYQKGLTDMLTVLEHERRTLDARSQTLTLHNNLLKNRIALYLALGGEL